MWKLKIDKKVKVSYLNLIGFLSILLASPLLQAETDSIAESESAEIFARIDDLTINYSEFMDIFRAAVRHKYYHGRVPESELRKFKKQVGEEIVIQILVHREAVKQGLKPDSEKIHKGVDEYDKKYANSHDWQAQREKILPLLVKRLERQNLIEQMQARVKNIKKPNAESVKDYYQEHPENFTEPTRLWISVILLAVPPSADEKMWTNADIAARQFKNRIEKGEDFSTIARQYSGHPSAVNGGDLGYLHQGMLEGDAQAAINALKINQLSDPVRVLEGVTIFRLNGVQAKQLKPFKEVRKRAADLLLRETQDKAWEAYTGRLLASANIYINEDLYAHNDDK